MALVIPFDKIQGLITYSASKHFKIDTFAIGGGLLAMVSLDGITEKVFLVISSITVVVNSVISIQKRILQYKLDKAKNEAEIRKIKQKK